MIAGLINQNVFFPRILGHHLFVPIQRRRDCGVYWSLVVLDPNILYSHCRLAVWLWGSPSTALGSWCPLDKLGNQTLCSGQESEHIISRTISSHVSDFVIVVIDNVDWTFRGHLALITTIYTGFPGGSVVKNLPVSAGDGGLIPGSGRSPGEGNGNPLQYSCLGNPVIRRVWWATVHGVMKESDMT